MTSPTAAPAAGAERRRQILWTIVGTLIFVMVAAAIGIAVTRGDRSRAELAAPNVISIQHQASSKNTVYTLDFGAGRETLSIASTVPEDKTAYYAERPLAGTVNYIRITNKDGLVQEVRPDPKDPIWNYDRTVFADADRELENIKRQLDINGRVKKLLTPRL